MKTISTIFIIALLAILSQSLSAQSWNQHSKQTADVRAANDNFGQSVAIDGNFAVVGANQEDEDVNGENTINNAGSAFIYKNEGGSWIFYQKIVAGDRNNGDFFGASVDISGNYIVVGAYQEDENALGSETMSNTGSAYIFENQEGTWTQVQKICASDRYTDDYFGAAVTISGDYIAVGAYQEDDDENGANPQANAGSVYLFKNNSGTWAQTQKLVSSDRSAADYFGCSIAMDGDNVVVGAYLEDENVAGSASLNNSGSAYVFHRTNNTWSQVNKIVASDREADDFFAYSVSISGEYIISGAYQEDHNSSGSTNLANAGSAYIFKNNAGNWSQFSKLTPADRDDGDQFGFSVSINGNYAVVSATLEDEDANGANSYFNAGSAYIYEFNSSAWQEVQKITPTDRATTDAFGNAVAMGHYNVFVTANMEDHDSEGANALTNSGSCYIFRKSSYMEIEANGVKYNSGQSINFGTAVAGQNSTSANFTIFNDGGETIQLNSVPVIDIIGTNMSEFIASQAETATSLAPGETTSFSVSFNPSATGERTAQLNIANTTAVDPFTLVLNGTGTTNAVLNNASYYGINIYPNPSEGLIFLTSEEFKIQQIIITDICGKVVYKEINPQIPTTLNLSNLKDGIYLINTICDDSAYVTKVELK